MKKLDKLEKVVPAPDTTFYGAYYYDGKEIELCDDTETLEDDDGQTTTYIRVKDIVKNGILYKEKELKVKQKDGRYIIENTKNKLYTNCNYDMCIDELLIKIWEEINEKNSRC